MSSTPNPSDAGPATLDMPLTTVWSQVREVRAKLEELLAKRPSKLRAASVMAASELVENAIKYGASVPAAPHATVSLLADDAQVRIVVRNGVESEEDLEVLRAHVEKLAATTDRQALYLEVMQQSLLSEEGSRLGIYRIGCEGGFDLSFAYADQVVTMTATRELGEADRELE